MKGVLGKQKEIIAVEIDDLSIKLAYGKNSHGKTVISKVKTEHGKKFSEDELVSIMKDFAADVKFASGEVISVIPARFGIFKNVEIPSVDKSEIRQIVDLQAGAHTPYPKNEIIIDYISVGVFHERYTKILLVIVKKDIVTRRYDMLKKAGLRSERSLIAAEPEAKAFSGIKPEKDPEGIIALVDVDMSFSTFTVIRGGKAIYMRSIPSGFTAIQVGNDLHIKPVSSGEAKKPEGMEPATAEFYIEVEKSLEAYRSSNIANMPSKIYFVGKKEVVSELAKNYKESTGAVSQVMALDVFQETSWFPPGKIEGAPGISPFSTVSALIEPQGEYLDLTPEDIRVRREIKKKSRDALKLGIFSMMALVLFCVALVSNLVLKNMYLSRLEKSYIAENREVEKLMEVMESTSRVKRFIERKGTGLNGMAALFTSIPGEVYLTNIQFSEGSEGNVFVFTGTADSMSRIFSLVTELENTVHFKNVNVDFTRSRSERGREVADFGLTLSFIKEME